MASDNKKMGKTSISQPNKQNKIHKIYSLCSTDLLDSHSELFILSLHSVLNSSSISFLDEVRVSRLGAKKSIKEKRGSYYYRCSLAIFGIAKKWENLGTSGTIYINYITCIQWHNKESIRADLELLSQHIK